MQGLAGLSAKYNGVTATGQYVAADTLSFLRLCGNEFFKDPDG